MLKYPFTIILKDGRTFAVEQTDNAFSSDPPANHLVIMYQGEKDAVKEFLDACSDMATRWNAEEVVNG